jgi:YVTN family beta-propeller protein
LHRIATRRLFVLASSWCIAATLACSERQPATKTLQALPSAATSVAAAGLEVTSEVSAAVAAQMASGSAAAPFVCSSDAVEKAAGACVRLGKSAFRIWGATRSGKMPKALAADHSSQHLYSSNMGSDGEQGLSVFRTQPLSLERHVPLDGNAIELFVSKDDHWLWLTDAQAWGQLERYDVHSWKMEQQLAVPGFPKWMVTDRDHSSIYVSLWTWDGISKVDVSRGTVDTLKTKRGKVSGRHSKNPRGLALSADERELYVLNNHDHTLSVIDVETWVEKERVQIGYAPRHIVPGRDATTFLVSLTGEDAVVEWDAPSRSVRRRFPVGKRPKTIAASGDGRFAFAANFVSNSLSVVDLESGESRQLPLGLHKPSGLAVRADDRFVYVSGFCSNDVWAIERIDDGQAKTTPLGEAAAHRPCLTCASTFAGCPFPPGKAPIADGVEAVKTDAAWGW